MLFEIGATIFGLLQGLFVLFNKRIHWIFYILQMSFLIIFSLMNKLYGDMSNSAFYLIIGIIGFILWNPKRKQQSIQICSYQERLGYTLVILLGTISLYYLLKQTDDPLPIIDSFTTISSFVATYYMLYRKIDTWFIWFVNDICYVIQYSLLPQPAFYLLFLNIIWTVLAVLSYFQWLKIMKGEKNEKNIFFR